MFHLCLANKILQSKIINSITFIVILYNTHFMLLDSTNFHLIYFQYAVFFYHTKAHLLHVSSSRSLLPLSPELIPAYLMTSGRIFPPKLPTRVTADGLWNLHSSFPLLPSCLQFCSSFTAPVCHALSHPLSKCLSHFIFHLVLHANFYLLFYPWNCSNHLNPHSLSLPSLTPLTAYLPQLLTPPSHNHPSTTLTLSHPAYKTFASYIISACRWTSP